MTVEALLAAINADPADDAPRLVYADWLQQRGDPRGEWIALACRIARTDELADAWPALVRRERRLWRRHGHEWLPRDDRTVRALERGFPSEVEAPASELAGLHARFPTATSVLLEGSPSTLIELDESGFNQTWLHLRYAGTRWEPADLFAAIGRSDAPTSLPSTPAVADGLLLHGSRYRDRTIVRPTPMMFGLRRLHLGTVRFAQLEGPDTAFAQLEEASISSSTIDVASWILAGATPGTPRAVAIRGIAIAPHHPVLAVPALRDVTRLDLPGAGIGREGLARVLAASASVEELDLSNCNIDGAGVELLARWPGAARLRRLDLSHNWIGARGAAALATGFPSLIGLRLRACSLGDRGAVELVRGDLLRRLVVLQIDRNSFASALAALMPMFGPRLLHLEIRNNPFDVDSIAALVEAPADFDPLELRTSLRVSAIGKRYRALPVRTGSGVEPWPD
ncbi:MAG: TIGR02996 domain-containing protein [Kofleriaceae bacterium]